MSRRNFYFFNNYFCRRLIKIYPYKNIRKILNIECEIGKNGYKPRNPIYCPIQKKNRTFLT